MLEKKTHKTFTLLLTGIACFAGAQWAGAADAPKLSGAIAGVVRGSAGVPQMGATVVLYSRQQRQIGKVVTDDHGEFKMLGLPPALYFVKVSLASFIPAAKEILVQPGMRSVMNVNLSTLFSTIQFGYPSVESGSIMTDDWKWVLRSASVHAADFAVPRSGPGGELPVYHGTHRCVLRDTRPGEFIGRRRSAFRWGRLGSRSGHCVCRGDRALR